MLKWLVRTTLRELDKIDHQYREGKITKEDHDKLSKQSIEKALSIENNIAKKECIGKF